MTILEQKEAFAAALTTVAGVTGYPSRPRVLKPGDAFVRWGGWSRADGGPAFMATWYITLILPQGSEDAADAEAYRVSDLLGDVLQPLMYVTGYDPTLVPVTGADRPMFALLITGRSE